VPRPPPRKPGILHPALPLREAPTVPSRALPSSAPHRHPSLPSDARSSTSVGPASPDLPRLSARCLPSSLCRVHSLFRSWLHLKVPSSPSTPPSPPPPPASGLPRHRTSLEGESVHRAAVGRVEAKASLKSDSDTCPTLCVSGGARAVVVPSLLPRGRALFGVQLATPLPLIFFFDITRCCVLRWLLSVIRLDDCPSSQPTRFCPWDPRRQARWPGARHPSARRQW
ncbi:hypothetical protein JB92DRAFT_3140520, partial [Gautieria morchelliformis]